MRFALLIVLAGLTLQAAASGVYKWVDKKGAVHYGDQHRADSTRLTREYLDQRKLPAQPIWQGSVPGEFVEQVRQQCANDRARLQSYRAARSLFGRDPFGNTYKLSPRQAQLMIAESDRDARRYCAPKAVETLYAEKRARDAADAEAREREELLRHHRH